MHILTGEGIKLSLHGAVGILLQEDGNKQFCHIGDCQTAAEEEDPFHTFHQNDAASGFFQKLDILHNAFVQQCLADISVKKRNTGNAEITG